MTEINTPLLRKAVEWVEEQAELKERGENSAWSQGHWVVAREEQEVTAFGKTRSLMRFVDTGVVERAEVQELDGDWCGTACCLAGYVATVAAHEEGKEVRFIDGQPYVVDRDLELATGVEAVEEMVRDTGRVEYVATFSDRVLGLAETYHHMYEGSNSASMIRSYAEELTGEKL